MADIVSVREFIKGLRQLEPGQSLIVVDAVRKQIITHLEVLEPPRQAEKIVKTIYVSQN